MKVILTEKVATLGNVGDVVNVSNGYARNFLFPKKFASIFDESNQKLLNAQKRALAKKIDAQKASAVEMKKKVEGMTLELIKRVGANGKLFGTVTTSELSKELESKGIHVERRLLVLENQIKGLGTFNVKAKLFHDVEANFKVKVAIDPKQAEELKKAQEEAVKAAEARKKAQADDSANSDKNVKAEDMTEEQRIKAEVDKLLRM